MLNSMRETAGNKKKTTQSGIKQAEDKKKYTEGCIKRKSKQRSKMQNDQKKKVSNEESIERTQSGYSSSQSSTEVLKPVKMEGSGKRKKVKRRSLSVNELIIIREKPRVITNKQSDLRLNSHDGKGMDSDRVSCAQFTKNVNFSSNNKQDKGLLPRRRGDLQRKKRSLSAQNLSTFTTCNASKSRNFIEDLENIEIDPSLMICFRFPPDVQELVGKYLAMQKNAFSLSRKKEAKEALAEENVASEMKFSSGKNSTPRSVKVTLSNPELPSKPSFGSILHARSLVKKWVIRAGKDKQKLPPISDIDAGIALELKTRCTPVFAQALKSLGYDARGEKMHGDMKTLKDFTPVSRIIMNLSESENGEKREK